MERCSFKNKQAYFLFSRLRGSKMAWFELDSPISESNQSRSSQAVCGDDLRPKTDKMRWSKHSKISRINVIKNSCAKNNVLPKNMICKVSIRHW